MTATDFRPLFGGCSMVLAMLAILASAGAMACGSASDEGADRVIRIAGSAWVGDGPTKVADELGLFNRDLPPDAPRIEVGNHGSGLEALETLLAGEAEFALAATTPTALALAGKLDSSRKSECAPVILAGVALSNQTHILVVRPDLDISSPTGLAGHRVGIMHGTSSHFGWSHVSSFYQLDEANVELVDIRVSDMADALLAGEIDAAVIWQPWELTLRDKLGERLIEFPMDMLYTVNWLLLVDREFALDNPELTQRVLRAYVDSVEFMDAEPERATRLHAEASGIAESELEKRTRNIVWWVGLNWSVLVNMGSQFEWLQTWPALDDLNIPEPRQYLYGAPLSRVAPELVTLPDYLLLSDPDTGGSR